jgi:NADH dehydrogenase
MLFVQAGSGRIGAGVFAMRDGYPDCLSAYAQRSLEGLGVEVELGQAVSECSADGVGYGGRALAAPAAEWIGAPADKAGRLMVLPDITVPGHLRVFAIGHTVTLAGTDAKSVPRIAARR